MDLQLKGKKAIVTGATKGIGLAIAETLAGEGCDIAVCARDGALVETTVADLSTRGVQAHGASADVTDGDSFRQWIEQAAEQLGGLDIMVANVSALAGASDEAAWRAGLETDVLGTVRAVEAGLPFLEKSDCGSIVAIASTAALENFFGVRAYNAIKAAVIAYMSALASTVASPIPYRLAQSISKAASGISAVKKCRKSTRRPLQRTRLAIWVSRKMWLTPSPFWPAPPQNLSMAPTWWSMVR